MKAQSSELADHDKYMPTEVQIHVKELSGSVRNRILALMKFVENINTRLDEEDNVPAYIQILESVTARELASAFCLPEVCISELKCHFLLSTPMFREQKI
jgi:hypothetical protein